MGYYERKVLPHVINVVCGAKYAHPLRRRVCEGLTGEVLGVQ